MSRIFVSFLTKTGASDEAPRRPKLNKPQAFSHVKVEGLIGVFQIWGTEWIWVAVVLIALFVGAKKIPEMARSLGKAKAEFEKGQIEGELEIKKKLEDEYGEDAKIIELAKSLDIDTAGKSIDELKEEIKRKLDKKG